MLRLSQGRVCHRCKTSGPPDEEEPRGVRCLKCRRLECRKCADAVFTPPGSFNKGLYDFLSSPGQSTLPPFYTCSDCPPEGQPPLSVPSQLLQAGRIGFENLGAFYIAKEHLLNTLSTRRAKLFTFSPQYHPHSQERLADNHPVPQNQYVNLTAPTQMLDVSRASLPPVRFDHSTPLTNVSQLGLNDLWPLPPPLVAPHSHLPNHPLQGPLSWSYNQAPAPSTRPPPGTFIRSGHSSWEAGPSTGLHGALHGHGLHGQPQPHHPPPLPPPSQQGYTHSPHPSATELLSVQFSEMMRMMTEKAESDRKRLELLVERAEAARERAEHEHRELLERVGPKTPSVIPSVATPGTGSVGSTGISNPSLNVVKYAALPTFSGEPGSFNDFWVVFCKRVDSSPHIDDVDKFSTLRAYLSGPPLDKLKRYDLSPVGYNSAKEELVRAYADPTRQSNEAWEALLNIPPADLSKGGDLERFRDELCGLTALLQRLGVAAVTLDTYVRLLLPRIPPEVHAKLVEKRVNEGNQDQTITMAELLSHLDVAVRTQRSLHSHLAQAKTLPYSAASLLTTRTQHPTPPTPESTALPKHQKTQLVKHQNSQPKYRQGPSQGPWRKPPRPCFYCKSSQHISLYCTVVPDNKRRWVKVKEAKACENCFALAPDHGNTCPNELSCFTCGERHHSSLCPKRPRPVDSKVSTVSFQTKDVPNPMVSSSSSVFTDGAILMTTFKAQAFNPTTGLTLPVSVFIDQGASVTQMSLNTARRLGLQSRGSTILAMSRCNTENVENVKAELLCPVYLLDLQGQKLKLNACGMEKVSPPITLSPATLEPSLCSKIAQYGTVSNLPPQKSEQMSVDILLGNDMYARVMGPPVVPVLLAPDLLLYPTQFGAILSGLIPTKGARPHTHTTSLLSTTQNLEDLVSQITSLDTIGMGETEETRLLGEDAITTNFNAALKRDTDGRYLVQLPFKVQKPKIPSNFGHALRRHHSSITKLKKEDLEKYLNVFHDYQQQGMIEPVLGPADPDAVVHYLPHFPVVKTSSNTTKIRPVFDAAARTWDNTCINDHLHTAGNESGELLLSLLLRFRKDRYALTADLKQAFLQVGVLPESRDYFRFLLPKPGRPGEYQAWRWTRLIFGLTSSPWVLAAVINFHMKSCVHDPKFHGRLSPEMVHTLLHSIYVDNWLCTFNSEEEGRRWVELVSELFEAAKMHLREFASTCPEAVAGVPECDLSPGTESKLLGLKWDLQHDTLSIPNVPGERLEQSCTKRTVLIAVASAYDPLGYAAPVLIQGRIIFQEICSTGADWDDALPPDLQEKWTKFSAELRTLSKFPVPRQAIHPAFPLRLVAFSDASPTAYGFCIYVVQCLENERICSNLILSKARVAPIGKKSVPTLPRLELIAATLAARGLKFVSNSLTDCQQLSPVLYIDSQIAIHWLTSPNVQKPYEKRRADMVKEAGVSDLRYIPTQLNVADVLTHGIPSAEFLSIPFFQGPQFLHTPFETWPRWPTPSPPPSPSPSPTAQSVAKIKTASLLTSATKKTGNPLGLDPRNFSSLTRLIEVTAYAYRFLTSCRRGRVPDGIGIGGVEWEESLLRWIGRVQEQEYLDTRKQLLANRTTLLARQLDLQLGPDGLLRLAGRLGHAVGVAQETLHPLLLPRRHPFTHLLILHTHLHEVHTGPRTTLSRFRERFWVPRGLSEVGTVIRRLCVLCRLAHGPRLRPPRQGPLPAERLTPSPAFTSTGWDILGPILVYSKSRNEMEKRWISLFTCAVVRALHLEVMDSLSGSACLNALDRFISRRGLLTGTLYTDNGTGFQGTKRVLESMWGVELADDLDKNLLPFLAKRRFDWKLIPSRSPHFGGFYERLVGLVKHSLRSALWKTRVSDDDLNTLVVRIEASLNSRPLTSPATEFSDSLSILTPAHFLSPLTVLGRHSLAVESPHPLPLPPSSSTLQKDYADMEKALTEFWRRWQTDYLHELRTSHRQELRPTRGQVDWEPEVGKVYLIADRTPRGTWKLGRVERVFPGQDSAVRVVEVRLPSGGLSRRQVRHLVPLELPSSTSLPTPTTSSATGDEDEESEGETIVAHESDGSEDVSDDGPSPDSSSYTH